MIRRLLIALAALLLVGNAVGAQEDGAPPTVNRFGVVEGFWLPDAVCDLGAGWERIIFDWAQHQPTGPDDWNTLNVDDRWLAAARDCNREVVAIVKNTPAWATDGTPLIGVPRGLDAPIDSADNLWAAFLQRAAAYYAERGVTRFIIWNEPDIEAGTYGYEFEGDLPDYAQMLRTAYHAVRLGNLDARVHLSGTTYWHDVNAGREVYLAQLLRHFDTTDADAPAHNYYIDAITLHIYFRSETIPQIVGAMRAILDTHGIGATPVWIVETNASPNRDPLWQVGRPRWQITLEQQSAFLVQAAALALAVDVERVAVYKFFDWSLPAGAESWGLLRADESRRPAFATWQWVIAALGTAQSARWTQTETVTAVVIERPDDHLLIAWARTADPALIAWAAQGERATVGDQYGASRSVAAADGRYLLALPGAVCNAVDGCAVGGSVIWMAQPRAETIDVRVITPRGGLPLSFADR